MYSVPSANQPYFQTSKGVVGLLASLRWFLITFLLSAASVDLSDRLHTALTTLPGHLSSPFSPLIFEPDPGSRIVLLISWCLIPGFLIATLQAFVLVWKQHLDVKAIIYIILSMGAWMSNIWIYLIIYERPADPCQDPSFGVFSLIAACAISIIALLISTSQWRLMQRAPAAIHWIVSNALGYALGWGFGMYVLSRGYWSQVFDCWGPV